MRVVEKTTVWVRCSDPAKVPTLLALEEELQANNAPIFFEITLPEANDDYIAHPSGHRATTAFCDSLKPGVVLWVGGQFDPASLAVCQASNVPVIVIDAGIAMLPRIGRGWFPGKTRSMLHNLHRVYARSKEAADGLRRAGVQPEAIKVAGTLQLITDVLPYDEDERFALAKSIGPRPIWQAAHIKVDEAKGIALAQRQAALRAHRLLCIVTTQSQPEAIAAPFTEQGLTTVLECDGNVPSEATQVFIAEAKHRLGLWTRLAPITYLGGSQTIGARIDPFQIAMLGSVVVHGRKFGAHTAQFDLLMSAQASFISGDQDGIGPAVAHLLSADKAARYAQAGWDVTSRGAEMVNTLSDAILEAINKPDLQDA